MKYFKEDLVIGFRFINLNRLVCTIVSVTLNKLYVQRQDKVGQGQYTYEYLLKYINRHPECVLTTKKQDYEIY